MVKLVIWPYNYWIKFNLVPLTIWLCKICSLISNWVCSQLKTWKDKFYFGLLTINCVNFAPLTPKKSSQFHDEVCSMLKTYNIKWIICLKIDLILKIKWWNWHNQYFRDWIGTIHSKRTKLNWGVIKRST